jgi:hypothetical protein
MPVARLRPCAPHPCAPRSAYYTIGIFLLYTVTRFRRLLSLSSPAFSPLRLHLLHVRAQLRRIPVYSGRVRHPPSSAARKIRGAGTQPPGCQAPDHARRVGNTDEMTEGRARVASRRAAAGGDGWGCAPLQQAELLAELRSGGLQVVELFVELPPERLALLQRHLQVVALRLLLLL